MRGYWQLLSVDWPLTRLCVPSVTTHSIISGSCPVYHVTDNASRLDVTAITDFSHFSFYILQRPSSCQRLQELAAGTLQSASLAKSLVTKPWSSSVVVQRLTSRYTTSSVCSAVQGWRNVSSKSLRSNSEVTTCLMRVSEVLWCGYQNYVIAKSTEKFHLT